MKNKVLIYWGIMLILCMNLYTEGKAQDASIILSDPFVVSNLTHFTVTDPNNEPYTVQTIIGGQQCRQIPGSKYGYFNVNDATISAAQNNLIFTVTYYDEGTDDLAFQYNATGGVNYKHVGIKKTSTNTWITATIALTDASMRNAQNNAADFRIGTTTGYNNYIREITITIGSLNPSGEPVPITTGSTYSEFMGKAVTGYQVWFNTGTPSSGWFHWSGGAQPSVGHLNFEVYPDVTEYDEADLTQTGFANLGNGEPSKLFHSSNTNVINKHFDWMQTAGIDGVALQRFINGIGPVINNSPAASPLKVKAAAEATNRLFYICYDISSTGLEATWDEIIRFDWVYNIEQTYALTSSPAYATVNNKPVVQIWGTGFDGGGHPGTEQETIDLINFLKARGCYVIGGVPTHWRTGTEDSKPDFMNAYKTYDMISPWAVGRFGDLAGANNFKNNQLIPDKAFTDLEGIDYMPVLFPGFSWSQWNSGLPNAMPRLAGEFIWRQAFNIKDIGVSNMYFAMLDEYDEGTSLMKMATDYSMLPTDQYFVTASADGIWTSSDFYLRVAGAATEMLKGSRPVTAQVPVPYSEGPVYYRNSFEKRLTYYEQTFGYFNVDPCFYNEAVVSATNVSGPSVVMENNGALAHTGLFFTRITGNPSSAADASYYYKISETNITVKPDMELSFWKYSENILGQYTSVDLLFLSGKRLSALAAYTDQQGYSMTPSVARGAVGSWEHYTCQIGVGELIGDVVTGIVIGYDHPAGTGTFTAYFDDILIEDALAVSPVQSPYLGTPWPIPGRIEAEYYDNGGEGIAYHDFEATNRFNEFRTSEGVDVETTGDLGGGYNVGWIEAEEWLEYTVDVQETGVYTLEARVASGNAGSRTLHVEMEGQDISGPVIFEQTGGWQEYETVSVTTLTLTEGEQVMRIVMDDGGFNLNYVNFELLIPLTLQQKAESKRRESWGKDKGIVVYPNPADRGENIRIRFLDEETGRYQVRLYNSIGQSILEQTILIEGKMKEQLIQLPETLSQGYYQWEIVNALGERTLQGMLLK